MNTNSFPFYNKRSYRALGFSVPQRVAVCADLMRAPLGQPSHADSLSAVMNYERYYGLDQLPGTLAHYAIQSGSYRVHIQYFQNKQAKTQGTVIVLHGYLEHSALYWPLYNQLLLQGFDVIAPDLPGHGLSSGMRAGIRSFAEYQQMLGDVGVLAQQISACQPWLGIGQSTGGSIWLEHIVQSQPQAAMVQRIFLCSPLVRPTRAGWWQNRLGVFVLSLFRSRVPRLFRTNNHNLAFLTFIRENDALQMRSLHLSWVRALAHWLQRFEKISAISFPVWLAQGLEDNTVDWRFNNQFVRTHFRVVRYLRLPNCAHQLINETAERRAPVDAAIRDFLFNQPDNLG